MTEQVTSTRTADDERALNAAIDALARRMTESAPSADLPARILAKLKAETLSHGRRWRWQWAVAASAGTVILVMSIVVARSHFSREGITGATTARVVSAPVSAPSIAAATVTEARREAAAARGSVPTEPEAEDPNDAEHAWRERAIPALVGPDALEIDRLDATTLSIDPIEISPLALPPLDANGGGRKFD